MRTLSVTAHRRLGGFGGLLILIAVALAWWLRDSCAIRGHIMLSAWLGGSVAMLAIGRRSYEVRNHEPSCLEYWSETAWACLCTVVAGLGVGALIAVLSTTKPLSLDSNTYPACAPTKINEKPFLASSSEEASTPTNSAPSTVNKAVDLKRSKPGNKNKAVDLKRPKPGNKEIDLLRKNLEETLKKDLEETLKKELNDRINFWGTLFAWLLAILALAVTVVVWSLQRGAQDLKERFDTLEDFRGFKLDLERQRLLAKSQEFSINLSDLLESSREKNPEFQIIRVVQRLILASRQVQSHEFSALTFARQTDRLEGALDALSKASSRWDVAQLKPRALAGALRAVAEYLHSVGPLPWLPTAEWPGNIQKLFDLAERLDTLA